MTLFDSDWEDERVMRADWERGILERADAQDRAAYEDDPGPFGSYDEYPYQES